MTDTPKLKDTSQKEDVAESECDPTVRILTLKDDGVSTVEENTGSDPYNSD
jgi:hypothetical protein